MSAPKLRSFKMPVRKPQARDVRPPMYTTKTMAQQASSAPKPEK